ncbi:polyketide synthase [Dorcoceras hygrometricum]|uniref:Polyketide synthase n=1 Tax=Dorcoceras hygrometricum TaxID=472368 RepID=A0A2Z7C3A7_9LAMI|nr:polyketide synthase [Dorcoceras hygrometricum]
MLALIAGHATPDLSIQRSLEPDLSSERINNPAVNTTVDQRDICLRHTLALPDLSLLTIALTCVDIWNHETKALNSHAILECPDLTNSTPFLAQISPDKTRDLKSEILQERSEFLKSNFTKNPKFWNSKILILVTKLTQKKSDKSQILKSDSSHIVIF